MLWAKIKELTFKGEIVFQYKTSEVIFFDFVLARALAPLKTFLRLGSPLIHHGGFLVAMKGEKAEDELKKSQACLKHLSLAVDKNPP